MANRNRMTGHTHLNKYCHKSLWRLLSLVAVAFAIVCPSKGQTNAYGINDSLYNIYVEAYRVGTKPQSLDMARDMYSKAVQMGDFKAQCMALTLPVTYWYYQRKHPEQFFNAVDQLQKQALECNIEQYYYYGFSNKVNFLLVTGRIDDAITYIHEVADFACSHNHYFGIYSILNALAQVSRATRDTYLAIDNYHKALELRDRVGLDVEKSNLYRKLAECYNEVYDFDNMLLYGIKGYEHSSSVITKQRTICVICEAAFMLKKSDVFNKYYSAYLELKKNVSPTSRDAEERSMAMLKYMHDGDADSAIHYLKRMRQTDMVQRYLHECYRIKGDYTTLAAAQDSFYRAQMADIDKWNIYNFGDINARIINMGINMQNQKLLAIRQDEDAKRKETALHNANLKLANAQLTLRNSSLELFRTCSETDIMRLSYNRKKLEASRLKNKLVVAKAHNDFRSMLSILGAGLGLAMVFGLGVYLKTRASLLADVKDTHRDLKSNHDLLVVAKHHAEKANNVKTDFINNMSNDIRSPLNSITSLSCRLANEGRTLTTEQKKEMITQIQADNAALLQIVNGILKL